MMTKGYAKPWPCLLLVFSATAQSAIVRHFPLIRLIAFIAVPQEHPNNDALKLQKKR